VDNNYNLGDEAMLAGMIKLLQEQQDNLLITVFLGTLRTLRHVIPSDQYYRSGQFKVRHKLTIFQTDISF